MTVRRSFGRVEDIVPVPNLIEIQSRSFNDFVQLDYLPEEREMIGLEKVLRDIFPIDTGEKASLEYIGYELGLWACTCGALTGIVNRYRWHCGACKKSAVSRLDEHGTCTFCHKHAAQYQACSNCMARVRVHPSMTLDEARSSEQTFSMPLKIKIQLTSWIIDEQGKRSIQDIKEQDIFFADLPIMVDLYEANGRFKLGSFGTFLINGVDRVVVSQLHRSPGAVFSQSKKVKDFRGRPYYVARIIPARGSWLDFEFDSNDHLYVRVDKKKKLLATTFLQALGIPRNEIIARFYDFTTVVWDNGGFYKLVDESLIGQRIEKGMLPPALEKTLLGRRVTKEILDRLLEANIARLPIPQASLINRVVGFDIIDPITGEVVLEQGQVLTEDHNEVLKQFKQLEFKLIQLLGYAALPTLALTLMHDRCASEEDALKDVQAKLWPGDSASLKEIKDRLEGLFFNERFYDLTKVGRVRINKKLGLSIVHTTMTLTREDIVATIRYLINLRERGEGELDDIDHLGNRRVRLVGELLSNQVYLGFLRIERIVRERFRTQEFTTSLMPQDLLNIKPLSAVLREFFGLGQLSQYMDQTNPLSEVAHKRRLSALGPGGVLKDRATFEVRDVHPSHYGRICPIETPEGQTVGLISSLSTYAMVNDLGFIETAYRVVNDGKIEDKVVFLDAFQEEENYIAQADASRRSNALEQDKVFARHRGNYMYADVKSVEYVDLSPKQLISVSAALIPFLEHDDASRALMGANMQRQAVPLIKTEVPVVGTGMEREIVKASGAVITARKAGVVTYVSSENIIIRADRAQFKDEQDWLVNGIDIYPLRKFQRSSHSTWIHQAPIVKVGERVQVTDILSNGQAINNGELALGSNLLIAFMPWHGYNFEDAIVLNKRLVVEDALTSVHIDEHVVEARDTKLGPEDITRDIPNVSESLLAGLDDDGIVRIGTRVAAGDILVGKVTLKGDIQYAPEEKLLRAIFGEKSREVRDTSLRVPPGVEGTIVDVKIFSRSGVRRDRRYKEEVAKQSDKVERDHQVHVTFLQDALRQKLNEFLTDKKTEARATTGADHGVFTVEKMSVLEFEKLFTLKPHDKALKEQLKNSQTMYENQLRLLTSLRDERIARLRRGDTLPSGVIKMVKVYISMKRPISVGDKIAGRHGNKGVVSTIVPREDMPYLDDGTAVDLVFNPLGVPSRMNVGQILETILGFIGYVSTERLKKTLEDGSYAAVKRELVRCYGKELVASLENTYSRPELVEFARSVIKSGILYETPVFDGANYQEDLKPLLVDAGLPDACTFKVHDGRTGQYFDQPITVGSMYIMKLDHMVDDKLHARAVGPYSLVTQQPLGGKAQKGGQRLGEMEVWALEAYGAAYTLQEMLTYKSDDVAGRHKVYENIVHGEDISEPGVPESFNVLIKELQSLGLRVDLFKGDKEKIDE